MRNGVSLLLQAHNGALCSRFLCNLVELNMWLLENRTSDAESRSLIWIQVLCTRTQTEVRQRRALPQPGGGGGGGGEGGGRRAARSLTRDVSGLEHRGFTPAGARTMTETE